MTIIHHYYIYAMLHLKIQTSNAEAFLVLGQVLMDQEDYEQAIYMFNRAREIDQGMI